MFNSHDTAAYSGRETMAPSLGITGEGRQRRNQTRPHSNGLFGHSLRHPQSFHKEWELCIEKAWKYKKKNGTTVIFRDLFEKILIWAAVRLLLTIAVEDSQSLGILIEGLEQIPKLIAQCKVLEDLYSQSAGHDTGFDGALLELYVAILTFKSHAIQIYRKSTPNRLISAIKLPSNKLQDGLKMVWVKHQRVADCTRLIDAQYIRQFEDILRQFEQPIVRSATILQDYQDSLELQERETLLKWLSTIPYRKHHKLKRSERLEGSCEWLLNSADYIQWKDSSASSILWLNGIAGCGKSVLTSAVIESLCQESSSMGTAAPVAYFYCSRNTAEPERANPEEVLRSILEQVSSNTANLPIRKPVVEIFKNLIKENRGISPPQELLNSNETTEVLLKILQVDPFYVVIDALDECDPSKRYSLIESLKTIIDESASVVKVFISSRRDNDIVSQLDDSPCISIQSSHISKDIEDYVKKEVSEAIEKKRIVKGKLLPEEKKKIEQQITQALIDGSQGMFRWVTLQIQQLCKQVRVKGDIDSVLRKLPKSLEESHHLVYQDIMNMEEPSQKAAIRTLQVLLSTRRKLSQIEMLAAVTVDIDTNDVLVSTVDELLDVCCNLIIFDEEERILRFAHLSVREFLEKCAPRDYFSIQSRELFMMNRCLYIFLRNRIAITSKEQAHEIVRQREYFQYYAVKYWPEHCKLGQPDVVTSEFLKKFIGNDLDMGHSASYEQWIETTRVTERRRDFCKIKSYEFDPTNPPHIQDISCIYGLMAIIMTLLPYKNIDWNASMTDSVGKIYYPLVYAAKEGYFMIVRQFLSRYSDYYAKGSPGHEIICMSLGEAIEASHIEVAKTLLDYFMIDVNDSLTKELKHRYKSHSLLGIAVQKDREEMVKFLLHHGANSNGETNSVISSLVGVDEYGILEDNYESVHKQNNQDFSPLKIAVLQGNIAILDILCLFGADIMAKDPSGATLIHFIAKENHNYMRGYYPENFERVIEYLIHKGVDIAAVDNSQCTALHVAVHRDNSVNELLPVLVNAGTPINAQNNEGDTALSLAAEVFFPFSSRDGVEILLLQGADPSIVNNGGLTALDQAWKSYRNPHVDKYQRWASRSIIQSLTIESQDDFAEDI
ncbi:putative ankyrin repeat protein [Botrytis fragariae]|uniref:Putative ankyrin repeat protein n=1 Tax=Botrytis fragariae TaxID=1964551 RepID=A0A8H6AHA3_9HELO|nr:putative ankyrin repeat protein [Botrytis fragariae]KAF5867477.1 putative ankyrin repeat protein [Botrytis fragariae]